MHLVAALASYIRIAVSDIANLFLGCQETPLLVMREKGAGDQGHRDTHNQPTIERVWWCRVLIKVEIHAFF